jgi:hypothetical protein
VPTLTYIGPERAQDRGGEPVAVRSSESWPHGTLLRLQALRLASLVPEVYDVAAELLNGVPGDRTTDGGDVVYIVRPWPQDSTREHARTIARAYLPRLAAGVYYLAVLHWDDSGGAWVADGTVGPLRVLPRARWFEEYRLRQRFPKNFPAGTRSLAATPFGGV